ncbi:tripartite tricarboxylate transporter substrate binding protein [Pigmentiphaga sp.]|uniref:Bug family tripartite tricarboxylate transporter substrate binding protein n=1 Tax=Pigmentiphaga sp. TaxID=1977564 RepID=UPI0025FB63FC|nr:tripartite tricarboxylate transporter substrate binding protein [Pigmentiphaga sp.]
MFFDIRLVLLFAAALCCQAAQAQGFPSKPVRIVVGAAAGGPIDTAARVVGEKLAAKWGQPVIVENRPGASEMIGAAAVAKSAPDGYTLFMASSNPFTINPAIFEKLPYDPSKSFTAIGVVAANPMAVVSNPAAPFDSLGGLIDVARAHPGQLSWSTPGLGTMNHITGEWIAYEAGIKAVHVPYKGGPAAVNAVVAGEVPYGIVSLVQAIPFAKAGSVRMLAVTTARRTALSPATPTVAELAIPGFESSVLAVLAAPAGTPRDVIEKINADTNGVLKQAEVRAKFAALGAETVGSTPEEMDRVIESVRGKVAGIVARAGIKAE